MCPLCTTHASSRRGFLTLAAAGVATGLLAAPGAAWAASAGAPTSLSADQALARLVAGNDKYLRSPDVCASQLIRQRGEVAKHQAPWATILSCADSRVPPELLFGGAGVGELFVARNAGNMADTATMGSIEYGSAVLGVPLIVVLGHERCGAVAAAVDMAEKQAKFPGSIGAMVSAIVPAVQAVKGKPGDPVDNAVRESASRTARYIATSSPLIADLVKQGKVKVVAARYDLDDGKVEFFA
jgi:carbonic anhydrase